jgi:hypothetical protein
MFLNICKRIRILDVIIHEPSTDSVIELRDELIFRNKVKM